MVVGSAGSFFLASSSASTARDDQPGSGSGQVGDELAVLAEDLRSDGNRQLDGLTSAVGIRWEIIQRPRPKAVVAQAKEDAAERQKARLAFQEYLASRPGLRIAAGHSSSPSDS